MPTPRKRRPSRDGAEQLAAIFEAHFAGLLPVERAAKEQAFDKTVARIGRNYGRKA